MYFSAATMLMALLPIRLLCIINWKIKIILTAGKEGRDNIDVLIRLIPAHLTQLSLVSLLFFQSKHKSCRHFDYFIRSLAGPFIIYVC